MAQRLNFEYKATCGEVVVEDFNLRQARDDYLRDYGSYWLNGARYRYLGAVLESNTIIRTIETKVSRNQKIAPGEAYIVTLGGPFQEVGKQAENIGGDSQKMG